MIFPRKRPPTGESVSEEFAAGMRRMEGWYTDFVIWAYAYISLLEKRVSDLESECKKTSKEDQQ